MDKIIKLNKKQYSDFLAFNSAAFNDYLSARILINTGQLSNGLVMANTAIEKYFKLFLVVQGKNKKTHSTLELFKSVSKFGPNLSSKINSDFIQVISKAYKIRYLEELPIGYKVVISQRKILSELDYTVNLIESSWNIEGVTEKNKYRTLMSHSDEHLFFNNYVLNGANKKDFIEAHPIDNYFQIEKHPKLGLVEVFFQHPVKDDGIFIMDGIKNVIKENEE